MPFYKILVVECQVYSSVCKNRKRGELFNAGRGLVEELSALHDEHDMEWTAVQVNLSCNW
jgi:hypothetical protein